MDGSALLEDPRAVDGFSRIADTDADIGSRMRETFDISLRIGLRFLFVIVLGISLTDDPG